MDDITKECKVQIGPGFGGKEGELEVCPFLIPDLGGTDYCGYYGRDLRGKRLGGCEVEAVLARRVEKDTFTGRDEKC